MDAVKRTKILYDDPNSFFKAKSIEHLRNVVGSSLITHTRTSSDVRMDTSRESIIQKLIIILNDIDSLLIEISGIDLIEPPEILPNVNNYIITYLSHYDFSKFSKLIHLCNEVKMYLKNITKMTGFIEEDIKILSSIYRDLDIQYNRAEDNVINVGDMIALLTLANNERGEEYTINGVNPMLEDMTMDNTLDPIVIKAYNILRRMLEELQVILQTKNVPAPTEQELIMGGSRFGNVLSAHQRFIQQQPYKRFL